MKQLIPYILVLLISISCTNKEANVQSSMDANAKSMLSDPTITSVSIGILMDGKAYTSHYGELDAGKGNAPNDETIYEIASVTKTMTGTLVAQAVMDGKFNLEDDIRKHLKDDYPNFQYNNTPITIKNLVTHTSRLPANAPGVSEALQKRDATTFHKVDQLMKNYSKDLFFKQMKNAVLDTIPGVIQEYNNLAPNLIAHILENVYQKSYDELLNEFIFEKSRMTSTKVRLTEIEKTRLANGYNGKGQVMPNMPTPLWGAEGGMKSTTTDLIKYMRLQLDSTNTTITESHRPNFYVNPNFSLGYYWLVKKNSEGIYYSHHGGAMGTQNWFFVFPEQNMGVSVITNSSSEVTGQLLYNTVMGMVNDLKPNGKKSVEKAITPKTMQHVDEGIALYHQLKKDNFDTYNFESQNELNNLGYALLAKNKVKDAIKIFALLVSEFPKFPNPYDSLGEAYFINKEYELAIKNYKISLELNPENTAAAEMIAKIEKLIQ
jgi:CubicO group peptidase (beta-lactamase class C family)